MRERRGSSAQAWRWQSVERRQRYEEPPRHVFADYFAIRRRSPTNPHCPMVSAEKEVCGSSHASARRVMFMPSAFDAQAVYDNIIRAAVIRLLSRSR